MFRLFWVFVAGCRLSLVVASGNYSLIAERGRLIVVVFLVVEHTDSVIVAHQLSCHVTCGIFPEQDQACVPYIGRWILNLQTTEEALMSYFLLLDF